MNTCRVCSTPIDEDADDGTDECGFCRIALAIADELSLAKLAALMRLADRKVLPADADLMRHLARLGLAEKRGGCVEISGQGRTVARVQRLAGLATPTKVNQ